MNNKASLLNKYWSDIYFYLHYPHKEKISHQAIRILQIVERYENIGINEIASYIQISQNTCSEHVKRMIEKNYLLKKKNSLDERKVSLELTELGKEILFRNTSLDEEKLNSILNELNDTEKNIIEEGLKILRERAKQCL